VTAPQPSADAEGMSRARDLAVEAATVFKARLARANHEVLALRSTWTGAAANDFGDAMREWEHHITTVIDELDQMAGCLRVTA
jgi:WXG100 family type VII secretion target